LNFELSNAPFRRAYQSSYKPAGWPKLFILSAASMFGNLRTPHDLFEIQLQCLYNAERQLTQILPLLADKADDSCLRAGLEEHLRETKSHMARLHTIGQVLNLDLECAGPGPEDEAMHNFLAESQEVAQQRLLQELPGSALLATAQRIEHYEIAGYGTAADYAQRLGHAQATQLLYQTLAEAQQAHSRLAELASSYFPSQAD
jgi:ferritin-like metal-binding protein YciE